MKYLYIYSLLLFGGTLFAQDSLIISSHQFANDQLTACKKSKNQLLFLDSLILITSNGSERAPGKMTSKRFFSIQNEKLLIYHMNAGWVCRLRGDFYQALNYFDTGRSYLDSLDADDLENYLQVYNYYLQNICYEAYRENPSTFNSRDCAFLFPEWNEESFVNSESDSIIQTKSLAPGDIGKFYIGDSLKIVNRFKSGYSSIKYFNQSKNHFLYEIQKNPTSQLFRESVWPKNRQDTVIIMVSLQNSTSTISKEVTIVYSSIQPFHSKHYLSLFSNISYKNAPEAVSFYVPVILKPESPNNYNKMEKVEISDGYFLIEYETPRPIQPD